MYTRPLPERRFCKHAFILAAFLFGCLLMGAVPGMANGVPDTTISPRGLKAYEGYYKFQFEKGTDSYIHIAATEKGLVLKQMWDGKEISFTPQTALDFVGDGGKFPLKFTKERNGKITHVLAFNRDLWTKTNDYKPPVGK